MNYSAQKQTHTMFGIFSHSICWYIQRIYDKLHVHAYIHACMHSYTQTYRDRHAQIAGHKIKQFLKWHLQKQCLQRFIKMLNNMLTYHMNATTKANSKQANNRELCEVDFLWSLKKGWDVSVMSGCARVWCWCIDTFQWSVPTLWSAWWAVGLDHWDHWVTRC